MIPAIYSTTKAVASVVRKVQAQTGLQILTSAIPAQCSTSWTMLTVVGPEHHHKKEGAIQQPGGTHDFQRVTFGFNNPRTFSYP